MFCYIKDESAQVILYKDGQEVCSECHNKWTHLLYISISSGDACRPYPRHDILYSKKIYHCSSWCSGLLTCKNVHSNFEYDLWRDEQEILRAVQQPRSNIRISLKGTVPQICQDMLLQGYCSFRSNCHLPHSHKEFKMLEAMTRHAYAVKDEKISGIHARIQVPLPACNSVLVFAQFLIIPWCYVACPN